MTTNRPRRLTTLPSKREAPEELLFNELNIRRRVCFKFVRKSDHEVNTCVCNRSKDKHHEKEDIKGAKWSLTNNTHEEIDPRHGSLSQGASFAQLALDTPVEKTEKLLLDVWKIPKPRLIMSIIGGAKYFTLSDRLESNFINGIIKVALNSEAWMITNGYNIGIVQVVGQAINKFKLTKPKNKITAIGICKWGSVKNVKKITSSPEHQKQKNSRKASNDDDDDNTDNKRRSGERDLELNHSHYLMLDDGRYRYYDTGDYRTNLCIQVAKLQHENEFPTPVVTIVVEGGGETVTNMYHDLRANIPVVIIDGSGRVADFFKRWLLYTKEFDNTSEDSETVYEIGEIGKVPSAKNSTQSTTSQGDLSYVKPNTVTYVQLQLDKATNTLQGKFIKYVDQLKKELDAVLTHDDDSSKTKEKREKQLDAALLHVMYCLQPAVRCGIAVFDLNSDTNLSETIFRSICKARQRSFKRKRVDQTEAEDLYHLKEKPQPTSQSRQRHTNSRQIVQRKDENAQRSQLLELAMDWDCIDVAKELILQNSLDNILDKANAFQYALEKNLSTFVYEFIKLGINPAEIFFPDDQFLTGTGSRYKLFIKSLYTVEAVNDAETHLSSFIEEDSVLTGKIIQNIDTLNNVLAAIIGDYMHRLYFHTYKGEIKYKTSWGLKEKQINENHEMNPYDVEESDDIPGKKEAKQMAYDYIMRDLFLWSILMNHIDMAKVFLSHMKYRICAALIATKILKAYHTKAPHGELKENYMTSAEYFEKYAIACINQCERNDPNQACVIVLQQIELYGNVTCLQVAANAQDQLFIATPCCVQAMTNVWYDKVHPEQSRKRNQVAMAVGVFSLGLLAPFLVTYRPEAEPKEVPLEASLETYGINYLDPYPPNYRFVPKRQPFNKYIHRLINFHQSLRMKYCYHCMAYCFFLLLFSYVLLFKFQPPTVNTPSIDWTEILTFILVTCMLIEEIHYFVSLDNLTLSGRSTSYFRNLFKLMTLFAFVLFYIGFILRFTYNKGEDQFTVARIIMAIDLEIWWLRSLSFIIVIPFLGPHLVAIGKMLKDLLFFMCIIAIVMTGYGVASRSMAYYPNADQFTNTNISTAFDGRSVFRQIAYPVYYFMYGSFDKERDNLDQYPDAGWSIVTHVLLAIHMLFVNILLTNLLIAMFSKRFDQVYNDTKKIWHSQQYIFTREYYTRSPVFPPISLFYDVYYLSRIIFYGIKRLCLKKSSDHRAKVFKMIPKDKGYTKECYEFEGASTYEHAHAEAKALKVTSAISPSRPDSNGIENKEDTDKNPNTSKKSSGEHVDALKHSANDVKQMQDDLAKLNVSLEEIKKVLSIEEIAKSLEVLNALVEKTQKHN